MPRKIFERLNKDLFSFNKPATAEIYTLSLHDALPICPQMGMESGRGRGPGSGAVMQDLLFYFFAGGALVDRKSTRLNSSHGYSSYAVFCLKKKTRRPDHRRGRRAGGDRAPVGRRLRPAEDAAQDLRAPEQGLVFF